MRLRCPVGPQEAEHSDQSCQSSVSAWVFLALGSCSFCFFVFSLGGGGWGFGFVGCLGFRGIFGFFLSFGFVMVVFCFDWCLVLVFGLDLGLDLVQGWIRSVWLCIGAGWLGRFFVVSGCFLL